MVKAKSHAVSRVGNLGFPPPPYKGGCLGFLCNLLKFIFHIAVFILNVYWSKSHYYHFFFCRVCNSKRAYWCMVLTGERESNIHIFRWIYVRQLRLCLNLTGRAMVTSYVLISHHYIPSYVRYCLVYLVWTSDVYTLLETFKGARFVDDVYIVNIREKSKGAK